MCMCRGIGLVFKVLSFLALWPFDRVDKSQALLKLELSVTKLGTLESYT